MLDSELDIIWNMSLICPWDCEFCCTDAVNVSRKDSHIILISRSLEEYDYCTETEIDQWPSFLKELNISPNYLDIALFHRQKKGLELSLEEKIRILESFGDKSAHIDFAGGDPLVCAENLIVILEAAKKFGKDNISITSTGHSLSRYPLELLCENIGVFEFTYDEPKSWDSVHRPYGYNASNLLAARRMGELGTYTKCQIPLHNGNIDKEKIHQIVYDLSRYNIDEILLMRTFPVGRGLKYSETYAQPKKEVLLDQIESFKTFSQVYEGPKIRLQCALKHLYEFEGTNPCDFMETSFGINYQGLLLSSAWATNSRGEPLANEFVLGNLVKESFSSIASTEQFGLLRNRLNENWGHCKIFSFINSNDKNIDAIFSKSDPLYISH